MFRTPRITVVAASTAVAAALGLGCSDDSGRTLAAEELTWNRSSTASSLILIVTDTTRRDRVGAYGGGARTPNFDAFARANLLFERAYSPSPWTKPTMVSLLTSLYPSQHGVVSHPVLRSQPDRSLDRRTDLLSEEFTTLAEVLQGAGFKTAAFVGNPWLRSEFGFAQGFDRYDDSLASWDVPGGVVSERGLAWLAEVSAGERFFLYLHYMDAHRPYGRLTRSDLAARADDLRADVRPLAPRIQQEIGQLVVLEDGTNAARAGLRPSLTLLEMAYDRGIENFDRALGSLLDGFADHPGYQDTAIVVVADHGEALYTRGWGNHGGALYEDEIAIPLAARLPGVTSNNARITSPVGLTDLLPTLCAWLEVSPPAEVPVFGRNWLQPASDRGPLRDRYLVTEGVMNLPEHRAVRFHGHKALWQPTALPYDPRPRALFAIDSDPSETRDLLTESTDLPSAAEIYADLVRGGADAVPDFVAPAAQDVPLAPAVLERLRALGYVK